MKYTEAQKEYARQRKNYLARARYRAKKSDLSQEQYKDFIEKINIPTAKEIISDNYDINDYYEITQEHFTADYIEDFLDDYEDTQDEVANSGSDDTFDKWFNYYPDGGFYVSVLTGEKFYSREEASQYMQEFDIQNAIDEGNEIYSVIKDILNDRDALHQRKFAESNHSTSMVLRPEEILAKLNEAIEKNADALVMQLYKSDENIIDLVQQSLYYGDRADEPLTRLFQVLTIDPSYERLVDDYMNAKESPYSGRVFTGSRDEGVENI